MLPITSNPGASIYSLPDTDSVSFLAAFSHIPAAQILPLLSKRSYNFFESAFVDRLPSTGLLLEVSSESFRSSKRILGKVGLEGALPLFLKEHEVTFSSRGKNASLFRIPTVDGGQSMRNSFISYSIVIRPREKEWGKNQRGIQERSKLTNDENSRLEILESAKSIGAIAAIGIGNIFSSLINSMA
ncbi:hypothetical protein Syun_020792 [Stephania yunnanensis]|uniref:Uncharacterized protein n=1 Tax=Stephania yunnanensis TaxID=152371 RepID=A0AAP0NQC5_9MAGN